jgi:hypothetical protein
MRVIWKDIGSPAQAGVFIYRDGLLTVRADEIAIWQANPTASFLAIRHSQLSRPPEYGLSSWELP